MPRKSQKPSTAVGAPAGQPEDPSLRALAEATRADAGGRPAPPANSLAQDPELLSDFILESREHLATIESQSMALEQNPADADAIHAIFRGFHTIKGLAGFLELPAIQEMSHEVETLLDRARTGKVPITPGLIDAVLEGADYLRASIEHLHVSLKGQAGEPVPAAGGVVARIRRLLDSGTEGAATPEVAARPVAEAASPAAPGAPVETRAVKIDITKLDYLADMAGEMVIAQSLVLHDPDLAAVKSPRLTRNLLQLGRITAEIQKTSMAMRLVPIAQLFQRMVRLGRDLSRQCGKPLQVDTAGEETELDRTIVEELADPVMHMVRNAVDHGIEEPPERQAAGKPRVGRIGLRACHQSGHIVIEISDDGRGLNAEKILAQARRRGLSTGHVAESDMFNLIFEPGFSTADRVTGVSGRGVGMDVVRQHIQKLRGRTEIRSTSGAGTTFTLKLPLTLAMIEGLVVGVGAERYILPLYAVREMFRPARDALSTVPGRGEMALVRGTLLPVMRLYRRFGVKPCSEDPRLLIVAESGGKCFCLMVDELIGKQEVVIKSLGEWFRNIAGVAGGAILGDGRVGLILDMDGLYKDRRGD